MRDLIVSIVNTDRRELLKTCLDSMPAALGTLSARVVVLDNASRDGSADMVASRPEGVTLIRQTERRGFGANHNEVMRQHAREGRYVLLLNEDTELDPGSLEEMVRYMDAHPEVGVTGVRLVHGDGGPQSSYASFPTVSEMLLYVWRVGGLVPKGLRPRLTRFMSPVLPALPSMTSTYLANWTTQAQEPKVVDWVCGACFMMRRELIDRIGLLDEAFFIYFEETDWCRRAAAAGFSTVHLPHVRVQHYEAAGRGRLSTLAFQRSGYRYFSKYGRGIDRYVFRLGVWINAVVMLGVSSASWVFRPAKRAAIGYQIGTYWQVLLDRPSRA